MCPAARPAAGGGSRSAGAAPSPRVPPLRPDWLREAGGQGRNGLQPRWGRLRPGPPRQVRPPPAPAAPAAGLARAGGAPARGWPLRRGKRGQRDPRCGQQPVPRVAAAFPSMETPGRRFSGGLGAEDRPLSGASLRRAAEPCLHAHNWHSSRPSFLMSSRRGRGMAFPEETGNRSAV